MKVIIAGSRDGFCEEHVTEAIALASFDITTVISGGARGVDSFGESWARKNSIPIERFPAQWKLYGKSAGILRNIQMANLADALIALWNGQSPGTFHMIQQMKKANKPIFLYETSNGSFSNQSI